MVCTAAELDTGATQTSSAKVQEMEAFTKLLLSWDKPGEGSDCPRIPRGLCLLLLVYSP